MAETAEAASAALPDRVLLRGGAASALRDAGVAFLLGMALFGSLVGFKTEGALEITTHFGKATLFAAIAAAIRLFFDVFIWRQLDGGSTSRFLAWFAARVARLPWLGRLPRASCFTCLAACART